MTVSSQGLWHRPVGHSSISISISISSTAMEFKGLQRLRQLSSGRRATRQVLAGCIVFRLQPCAR